MASTSTDLWFKFYPKDWNGDHQLRMCSLAARGLWAGCLELMHTAVPYGHLLVNGKPPSTEALSVILTCRPREAEFLLSELVDKGVASRNSDGVIYSRRMVRDGSRRAEGRKLGKLGGNPTLKGGGYPPPLTTTVNTPDNGGGYPPPLSHPLNLEIRSQKLEARSQKELTIENKQLARVSLSSADADYARFCEAYPVSRRVGGKAARKAFKAATIGRNGTHLAAMISALEQHKRSDQWQNPALIPLMTTWLNQERWNQILPENGADGRLSTRTQQLAKASKDFLTS